MQYEWDTYYRVMRHLDKSGCPHCKVAACKRCEVKRLVVAGQAAPVAVGRIVNIKVL